MIMDIVPGPLRRRAVLIALVFVASAAAQETPTILNVDVENYVAYVNDVTDATRVARSPGPVAPMPAANFSTIVILADVTAVNGEPAKGTMVIRSQTLRLTPTPVPGAALADVTRAAYGQLSWEFLNADGSPIGTIYGMSLSGGAPSPGSPAEADGGTAAIVGGSGAFVGAKGTINPVELVNNRATSQAEDPSMRRINGGGRGRFVFQIYPMFRPEVVTAVDGPALFHSDNTRVSAEKPARPGEHLILHARGIRPTGSAAIEVLVNGQPSTATELSATQGPDGTHSVRFRVPDNQQRGMMTVRIGTGWIQGSPVRMAVE